MKKFYILFAALFAGVWSAAGQPFWHADLGNAPTGTVRLSYTAQTYSFETTDGTETGYDADAIRSSLNRQLSTAGFSWITVSFIESQTDTQFIVTLQLSRNTGTSSRSVYFGTNSRRLEILQQAETGNPEPDLPADKVVRVYPGCRETITLNDTNLGQIYSLKTRRGNNEITLKSITGTGGSIAFYEVMSPGDYWIENARNSNFTVDYVYPFTLRFDTDIDGCSIAADGDVQYIYFYMAWDPDFSELVFSGEEDIHFFEDSFDQYNFGYSENWDSHMKIYYGYDDEVGMCYVRVVSPPNLGPAPIYNDSFLCNGNREHITFEQSGNGHVNVVDVNYQVDRSALQLHVGIPDPQPFVTYSLYKDGTKLVGKTAFLDALALTAPLSAGRYEIRAEYEDETGRRECKSLKSVSFYGDSLVELSDGQNWIFSQTSNEQGKHTCDVTYYDGLGYPSQEIAVGATDNGTSDLIRPIVFDELHREAYKYLPYAFAGNYGKYVDKAIGAQNAFYIMKYGNQGSSVYPYMYDEYESSPLNRVLRSHKPGAEYQTDEHTLRNSYFGNDSTTVLRLDIDAATNELRVNGYYASAELSGVRTTDEDGAVTINYTDKEDHLIYSDKRIRRGSSTEQTITRYVYDDCGRLGWVVTPEGSENLEANASYVPNGAFARAYCYVYTYDDRGRMSEKQFPGREPEFMVYDRGDRLAMQQDGNLRTSKKWIINKYDAHGRIVEQRLAQDDTADPSTRDTLQAQFDDGRLPLLYTLAAKSTLLYEHCYDEYPTSLSSELAFAAVPALAAAKDNRTKGLPTYEKLALLGDGGVLDYYERAFYYDYKGRVIQTVQTWIGVHRTTNKYDFVGNLIAQQESYAKDGVTDMLDRTFTYDSRNRLLRETAQVNEGEQAVVNYAYDELGRLSEKTYGTGEHSIREKMNYNIQGWLTDKSNNLFTMKLRYYDPLVDTQAASYTGNISEWQWQHRLINGTSSKVPDTYVFTYDDLSRLTDTKQYRNGLLVNEHIENNITYDKNGNIITLNRLDNGTYVGCYEFQYSGNQRERDIESDAYYAYDANGNVTEDALSGFGISYNILNLPECLQDNRGSGEISHQYWYLADGTKEMLCDYDYIGQRYVGSLVYNAEFIDSHSFESASFGDGRIVATSEGTEVHYFLTDHLGSTRVVVKETASFPCDLDRKDYYPFGIAWKLPIMPTSDNRYTFSGKEQQVTNYASTDFLDFGSRLYDPNGAIFLQQDPLSEKYVHIGQYNYCAGNPIKFIDLLGLDIYRYDDQTGGIVLEKITNDKYDQIGKFKYDKKTNTYELKTNKKGEAKTRIDKIEKGILSDGMNFKTDSNIIEVGGEGQASVAGVESFIVDFADMIGKEVGGYYLSNKGQTDINYIYIGNTINNSSTDAKAGFNFYNKRPDLYNAVEVQTHYHTHLSHFDLSARLEPSTRDKNFRNEQVRSATNPNGTQNFIILTRGYSPIQY